MVMDEFEATYEVRADKGYVLIRVKGPFPFEGLMRLQQTVVADHDEFNRLWDFRAADLTSWTGEQIELYIGRLQASFPDRQHRCVGAIVSRDIEFGLARMFELSSQRRLPIEAGVFRDEAEAVKWIEGKAGITSATDDAPLPGE